MMLPTCEFLLGQLTLFLKKDSLSMWFTTIFVPPLLCVNFWQKKKDCQFIPSLFDRFSAL